MTSTSFIFFYRLQSAKALTSICWSPPKKTRVWCLPLQLWVISSLVYVHVINTLRPRQNGRHSADDIFKCIFLNENVWIPIKISLKFVPLGLINNIPSLVQIMAWRPLGDKPLSEPMMVSFPTHICVTRPEWVNPCHAGFGWENYICNYICIFFHFTTLRWHSSKNLTCRKLKIYLSIIVNVILVNILAMQRVKASVAVVLIYLSWNIQYQKCCIIC